ncbi:MAG: rhodanese-like domain-containing protein [Lachnospiraceae bacterium]
MKKYLLVLLGAAMAVSLSACATKTVTETTTAAPATEAATEAPAETTKEVESSAENDVVTTAAMTYFADFPDDKHMIVVADLFSRIDDGEEMFIIDIRRADDYAQNHLKGAVNIPYGLDIAENLNKIPDDVPVYVNCYSGQTSSQTIALLNVAGKYATNIQSGWNNGISQTEGYEAYIDTEEAALPGDIFEVDSEIVEAITAYYKEATGNAIASFNFKPEDLMELVDVESEDYTILSVRQAEDYEKGHIAGAINIPFAKGMQEQFTEIPTDKPVLVYCYSGQTSSQTMAILRMLGYEAYSLSGGMGTEGGSGWLGGGYPVVTE